MSYGMNQNAAGSAPVGLNQNYNQMCDEYGCHNYYLDVGNLGNLGNMIGQTSGGLQNVIGQLGQTLGSFQGLVGSFGGNKVAVQPDGTTTIVPPAVTELKPQVEKMFASTTEAVVALQNTGALVNHPAAQNAMGKIAESAGNLNNALTNVTAAVAQQAPPTEVKKAVEAVKSAVANGQKAVANANGVTAALIKDQPALIPGGAGAVAVPAGTTVIPVKTMNGAMNGPVRVINQSAWKATPATTAVVATNNMGPISRDQLDRLPILAQLQATYKAKAAPLVAPARPNPMSPAGPAAVVVVPQVSQVTPNKPAEDQAATEYNNLACEWSQGRLAQDANRYAQWKKAAKYSDYCNVRKFLDWHNVSGWKMNEFPSYYMWKLRDHQCHKKDGAFQSDYAGWKNASDFDDYFVNRKWNQWKEKKHAYERRNRDNIPKEMKYDAGNFMKDSQYVRQKKNMRLKDYVKLRQYADWSSHVALTGDNVADMAKYKMWAEQNDFAYNPKTNCQLEAEFEASKCQFDFQDYTNWFQYQQWKNLKSCGAEKYDKPCKEVKPCPDKKAKTPKVKTEKPCKDKKAEKACKEPKPCREPKEPKCSLSFDEPSEPGCSLDCGDCSLSFSETANCSLDFGCSLDCGSSNNGCSLDDGGCSLDCASSTEETCYDDYHRRR